ncbi:hypothetical protein [Chromobacterium piscinae]
MDVAYLNRRQQEVAEGRAVSQEIFFLPAMAGKWIASGTVDCMQMNDAHACLFAMGVRNARGLFECE